MARMLRALAEQAARLGLTSVFLTSTVTAKRFYERNGFVQTGEPKSVYGAQRNVPDVKGHRPNSRVNPPGATPEASWSARQQHPHGYRTQTEPPPPRSRHAA